MNTILVFAVHDVIRFQVEASLHIHVDKYGDKSIPPTSSRIIISSHTDMMI